MQFQDITMTLFVQSLAPRAIIAYSAFGREDSIFRVMLCGLQAEIDKASLGAIKVPVPESKDKAASVDTLRLTLECPGVQSIRIAFLMDEFDVVVKTIQEEVDVLPRTPASVASSVLATEELVSELRPETSPCHLKTPASCCIMTLK